MAYDYSISIFKNETCVALRRPTKYQTCSSLYFFSTTFLLSALLALSSGLLLQKTPDFDSMARTQPITSFFQAVKIKQLKKLKLWNVMKNYAKLTWG